MFHKNTMMYFLKIAFNSYDLDLNLIKENCTIPVSIENEIVTSFAYNV